MDIREQKQKLCTLLAEISCLDAGETTKPFHGDLKIYASNQGYTPKDKENARPHEITTFSGPLKIRRNGENESISYNISTPDLHFQILVKPHPKTDPERLLPWEAILGINPHPIPFLSIMGKSNEEIRIYCHA